MQAASGEIPLLTIPAVLFPGTFLPTRIDDDAQCALLRECVDAGRQVGVVLTCAEESARSVVPYTTGCLATATIFASVQDEDAQAPLTVVLFGDQRFRVLSFVQQDPYLTGRVELLDDYAGMYVERRLEQVAQLFTQYMQLISAQCWSESIDLTLPHDPTAAAYFLASVLRIPRETKQRWLEVDTTAARLKVIAAYLSVECERQETLLAITARTQQRYMIPNSTHDFPAISRN